MSCSLLWLKDDFRVSNNQAITALIEDENKVKKAIYVFEKETYLLCEAQRWWLAKSLEIHKKKLENLNISLDVIHENTKKTLKKIIINSSFNRIYWNKSCHINENICEKDIKKFLEENNIFYKEFEANLLNPVEKIKKDDGTPFKVFTHYWKKAEQIYLKNDRKNNNKIYKNYNRNFTQDKNIKAIYPKKNWYKKFEKYWEPSEENAEKILDNFIKKSIENYAINRDIPSIEGTSKLSPYLKFGQISVHRIMEKCLEIKNKKLDLENMSMKLAGENFVTLYYITFLKWKQITLEKILTILNGIKMINYF
jgi:deoxyribodipyrimidine photo-lyase